MQKNNWLISDNLTYRFKDLQKNYGKNVNKKIRDDLCFVCLKEWERWGKDNSFLLDENSIRYQIDFDFKRAYDYLIETIKKTNLKLRVSICSKKIQEGNNNHWAYEKYRLSLKIMNIDTKKIIHLDSVKSIECFCFEIIHVLFCSKAPFDFTESSFRDFLYGIKDDEIGLERNLFESINS
ncbi:hypothetical protein BKH42_03600 [Helicobacter sp. 13S00482-2]|uniref:hypothetical protein n=1 Tax=Helicobacter sp. 13S00482-2 TaxID=1476200 RepID=UPI000BA51CA8|nr:hypothetical protein [Helicobacter sp. 13S00482-2]PAF53826.1 hypothetical protein BKH42_03600 [Helicobacter sp. 13S00482-2]